MLLSTVFRRLLGLALVVDIVLLAIRSHAQTAPAWASVQRATPAQGSTSHSQGQSIAVAPDGSYYVAGRFGGTLTLGAVTLTAANGVAQLYLSKYSASGGVVWAIQLASTLGITDGKVAVDATGNVYLAGNFYTNLTLGTTVLNSPGQDAFLVKYDAQGVQQWVRQGGPYASANGLAIDAGGNVTVVGFCAPGMTFGGVALRSGGMYHYSFSPAGIALQAIQIGAYGSGNALISDLAQDGAGNLYLVGSVSGTVVLGNTTLTSTAGSEDMFLCKFDAAGILAWALNEGGPAGYKVNDVAVDAAGNPLVGGYSYLANSTIAINKLYVARFTTQGARLWSHLIATTGSVPNQNTYQPAVYGVGYDAQGGCLAMGVFTGALAFGATTLTNSSAASQLFVARYDGQGTALWAGQTAAAGPVSNGFATGLGMTVDAGGTAYICGTMGGTEAFGPVVSTAPLGSGLYEAFVAKLMAGGLLTATRPAAVGLVLQAYPNPASGTAAVVLPVGGGQLALLDALGRRVRMQPLPATAGQQVVSLLGLAPGLYQLRATLGNGQVAQAALQVQ